MHFVADDPDSLLLTAWDRAVRSPDPARPVALIEALGGGTELADRPAGLVTHQALGVVERWFGPGLEVVGTCEQCGARLEATVPVGAVDGQPPDDAPFSIETDEGTITLRLPTAADLAAVAALPDPDDAAAALLARCIVAADGDVTTSASTAGLAEIVGPELEARDPLALLTVSFTCPECGAASEPSLDVAAWCWTATEARVRRLLDDVHTLAVAYGWTEPEILALGPVRRAAYLELVS